MMTRVDKKPPRKAFCKCWMLLALLAGATALALHWEYERRMEILGADYARKDAATAERAAATAAAAADAAARDVAVAKSRADAAEAQTGNLRQQAKEAKDQAELRAAQLSQRRDEWQQKAEARLNERIDAAAEATRVEEGLRRELGEKRAQLDAARARATDLEKQLETQWAATAELEKSLASSRKKKDGAKDEADRRAAEAETCAADRAAAAEACAAEKNILEKRIAAGEKELAAAASWEGEALTKKNQLARRDDELSKAKKDLAGAAAETFKLIETIQARDGEVASLRASLDKAKRQLKTAAADRLRSSQGKAAAAASIKAKRKTAPSKPAPSTPAAPPKPVAPTNAAEPSKPAAPEPVLDLAAAAAEAAASGAAQDAAVISSATGGATQAEKDIMRAAGGEDR